MKISALRRAGGLFLTCTMFASLVSHARADLQVLPKQVALNGPHGKQQLLVTQMTSGRITADLTPKATFASSNIKVAKVDNGGLVQVVGDGETTITVVFGADKATTQVKVTGVKKPYTWDFRNHVIPVLTKLGCNSGACHGALAGKGGLKLSLRGYDPQQDYFVLTRQANGRRVNPVEPAHSLMLLKPTMAVDHGGGQRIDVGSPDYLLLADWIASGAPGPKADDVRITRLEVFPRHAVLKPNDALQVVVRAWYSDGRSKDVTRWAKFDSTEALIASVDGGGAVKVMGHGEAAINVLYSNLVASVLVTSPLPNKIDPKMFANAERRGFIDELVLEKLQSLHIPPSPPCDDYTFIRRAFLDATGILPTPAEIKEFIDDKRSDKRARLIDSLLSRPEFVDYWTYYWSDVLLISSRKLPAPAMRAFYQFVRQSIADNKPWDQFARAILTAQGNNLQNGATNYFMLHKDVTDLTETTSVTFLGMSITCARCHNHPLEKWTQDQYWSMANLFSRVKLKNGERGGEVVVLTQPDGDVLHLRRGVAMPPAPLDAKPLALTSDINRRRYFADWLTAKDNPYFAKALVNRVWKNFMGRGLVEAVDDLRQTNPPSNPALLDALANDFVKNGYGVKHLMRIIMNSAAYQRSSAATTANKSDDRFYSHYLVRRLPAEVILDAYSQTTLVPTVFNRVQVGATGGERGTSDYPLGTRALQLPDTQLVSQFLDAFGRPDREQACSCEREDASSVSQALQLNNGKTLNDRLRDKKSRVSQLVKEKVSDADAIRRVYMLALCRAPTQAELTRLSKLMVEASRDPQTTRREVIEDLFWAVLTSREFLFNR